MDWNNGWPYLHGSTPVYQIADYTQTLSTTLLETLGQGTIPPSEPVADTGWIIVDPTNPDWEQYSVPLAVRRIGSVVYMRGGLAMTADVPDGIGPTLVGTVPAGCRPGMTTHYLFSSGGSIPLNGYVTAGGNVHVAGPSGHSRFAMFGGIMWLVD